MKIKFISLLFVILCAYSGKIHSQNAKVTITQSDIKVNDLLNLIESQTNYLFVYNKRNIDLRRRVNIDIKEKTVSEVLSEVFKNTGIKYIMEGDNIILTKSKELPVLQQNSVVIKGNVTDMKGEEIIGATVVEYGTRNGAITNASGNFTITVSPETELLISYLGYKTQIISIKENTYITVRLEENTQILDNVVVTAMGIRKKESSLTYSTQLIDGEELTRAKDINLIHTLAGKTAGVQIARNSSGLGASAKVLIRGNRSINGNNHPLYVIDGVPMLNNSNEQAVSAIGGIANSGNRDGGDGISNLNPDDIESINILKGASAAALYGWQAANGVILITTKRGKPGVQKVTFSSTLTTDNVISLPKYQNNYGMHPIEKNSWGKRNEQQQNFNNTNDFFNTGITTINSIAFTTGNEKVQTYFSYANTYAEGAIKTNNLAKHNISFRETAGFFNNKLTLDANLNLMIQTVKNKPTSGGYYMNPLIGLYTFPRGEDISEYKNKFEVFDPERNLNRQNWYTSYQDFEQNPYWLLYRAKSKDKRMRAIASLTATLNITNWLTLQARGTVDYVNDDYEQKMYATTAPSIAGDNGRYITYNYKESLAYGDVMALINYDWNNYSFQGALGSSITSTNVSSLRLDSKTASLYYPNVFTVANIRMNQAAYIQQQQEEKRILQSVFTTLQLGWKKSLYLEVTARNDWSSTLAFTKSMGFFYPSVGVSWVLNKTLKLPEWLSYGKLRASWAKVGNDLPIFISNIKPGSNDIIGAGGSIISYSGAPLGDLKPEMSTSWELGSEWKFFNYRADIDITYYKTNTRNQLFTTPTSAGAPYKYHVVNGGNIENKGIEITMGVVPVLLENFYWKTQFNFSTNKNKVIEIHPDLNMVIYGDEGFSSSYSMRLLKGGSFGDIYGKAFERDDNGNIVIHTNSEGNPIPGVIGEGNTIKVGNCSPNFLLGWNNTFRYKDITVYLLIDGRFGGDVLSHTEAELDQRGVSKRTGIARDRGYVDINGTHIDPKDFYTAISGRSGCTEFYMFDATNIRLRELSIGYSFPKKLLGKSNIFENIQLSFVGRNLFFFAKKAPFDPDATLSIGNDNQGIDVFGMPSTRSFGFNVKFVF
ncbi:SusC/RagA family TonB-linked outer membrane protein [Bacteroides sp. 519]|uniref:SusC/RagA family TonB-linked outer membrane protein n=1 Tax=Bacteroides sp. 519 TaxID=2302937 RepID=UPI0013D323BE|nr:SusC/RagA family TonB-linked outer membrane protein [Bacteroides sp. 519]NDV57689.1 SusC/RagA family TonB-linked outer membrane protein [Bacteroides sp. 519]